MDKSPAARCIHGGHNPLKIRVIKQLFWVEPVFIAFSEAQSDRNKVWVLGSEASADIFVIAKVKATMWQRTIKNVRYEKLKSFL